VDTQRSFTSQRDFRAFYAEDTRVPARRAERRKNGPSRQKAQFHQPIGEVKGEVQVDQSRSLAAAKFRESARLFPARRLSETQLHLPQYHILENGCQPRAYARKARVRIAGVIEASQAREYTRDEACRLLKISRTILTTWERYGFVAPAERYLFRDLVALTSLAQLRRNRVRPERIRRMIQTLRTRLAHIQDPLAELKIFCDGKRISVQVDGRKMEPITGQLLLDFDRESLRRLLEFPSERASQTAALAAEAVKRQAQAWFEKGVAMEQEGQRTAEVISAYKRAVELDPVSSGAWLNLGTIQYGQRKWAEAEECYRKALAARPEYALAHYNLGNLFDETGRQMEAIEHYRKALELDPSYADAHYNLALLYQAAHDPLSALRHWRIYLHLEPAGYWAGVARRELARLRQETVLNGAIRRGNG
jgi:tetratricopeptide (TPR) repeat protein